MILLILMWWIIGYFSGLWFHNLTRGRITVGDMGTSLFMGFIGPGMLLVCLFVLAGRKSDVVIYERKSPSDKEFFQHLENTKVEEVTNNNEEQTGDNNVEINEKTSI